MSERDVRTYSGLRLLPAALALLDVEHDPVVQAAVSVEQVERRGSSGSWIEDEVTIDWTRLSDPRRSSTDVRLAAFAPSIDELERQGWREITGEEFRRRTRGDDPDDPAAA